MTSTKELYKIGQFIKEERIKKNLTQEKFAQLLYLAPSAVSKWENGKNLPDLAKLVEISKILDCTVDELLAGERRPSENTKTTDQAGEDISQDSFPVAMPPQTLAPEDEGIQTESTSAPALEHSANLRIVKGIGLTALIFVTLSLAVFGILCIPSFQVKNTFYGGSEDAMWSENAFYIIVDYHGWVDNDMIIKHYDSLKEKYLDNLNENTDTMTILFYRSYNPAKDSCYTMDYEFVFFQHPFNSAE